MIRATPDTVFRFFMDDRRWASWWGAGSTIDPRPGGRVRIRYPDGTEVSGDVVEIVSPRRLVFTYGYVKGTPIPAGGSQVTIELDDHDSGTQLRLTHEFADATTRDAHVQGWRYQLAVFANVVADEVNTRAVDVVDGWFAAWGISQPAERERALRPIASSDVSFRDRYGLVDGLNDLVAHIDGALRFMPDVRLQRRGAIRHCQGVVLADWEASARDGQTRGTGTNVFVINAAGQIESVTGFWNA
jgi:uncharacterized protein YndB with AHSA1/START domain